MSKEFQRHASGGSFKRSNPGDGGVRVFKEQQDQIIEAQKLQQLRSEQYADKWSQGKRRKAEKEAQNRATIKEFENKLWQNRRDAIIVRNKRDIEAAKGKADEYGREAEFWKDFSTTYAKQWGKLAEGVEALHDKQVGIANIEIANEHDAFNFQSLVNSGVEFTDKYTAENPGKKLSDLANVKAYNTYLEGIKTGNHEQATVAIQLLQNSARKSDKDFAATFRLQAEGILKDLKRHIQLPEKQGGLGKELTPENLAIYGKRHLSLLKHNLNIGRTEGGRDIDDIWNIALSNEIRTVREDFDKQDNEKIYDKALAIFKSEPDDPVNRHALYTAIGKHFDVKGRALIEKFTEVTAGTFEDPIAAIDAIFLGPMPGVENTLGGKDGKTWSEGLYNARFKNEGGELLKAEIRDDLLKIRAKALVEDHKSEQKLIEEQGVKLLNTLIDKWSPTLTKNGKQFPNPQYKGSPTASITNYREYINDLESTKPYLKLGDESNPNNFLANLIGLVPGSANPSNAANAFLTALASNDFSLLSSTYTNLSADQQVKFEPLMKHYSLQSQGGLTPQLKTKQAEILLKQAIKVDSTSSLVHSSVTKAKEGIIQQFDIKFSQLNVTKYTENGVIDAESMVNDAWAEVGDMLKEGAEGKGIFAHAEAGSGPLSTVFKYFDYASGSEFTTVTREQLLENLGSLNPRYSNEIMRFNNGEVEFVKGEIDKETEKEIKIISDLEARELHTAIQTGQKDIIIPDNFYVLNRITGIPTLKLVNAYLKFKGFDTQVTEGFIEKAKDRAASLGFKYDENRHDLDACRKIAAEEILTQEGTAPLHALCTKKVQEALEQNNARQLPTTPRVGITQDQVNDLNKKRGY